ncbi:MAG TPA: hypothetical protein VIY86_09820, partial [Pirellulaceae bacterium]
MPFTAHVRARLGSGYLGGDSIRLPGQVRMGYNMGMSLFRIAWRSIQQRGLASGLTAFTMALGVMLVVAVLSIHGVVSKSFRNNSSLGYNMIVGPPMGGKEQLTLNTVYYLSAPVENIPYTFYLEFLERGERDKLLTESFDAKATLAVRDSLQLMALT